MRLFLTSILIISLKFLTLKAGCGLNSERYSQGYFNDDLTFFDTNTATSTTVLSVIHFSESGSGFSYRFTGTFTAPQTARYTLRTTSDDSSSIYINDALVMGGNTGIHSVRLWYNTYDATEGQTYNFTIYYGNYDGGAQMKFDWKGGPVGSWTTALTSIDPSGCCECVFMATLTPCTCSPSQSPTAPTKHPTQNPTSVTSQPTSIPTKYPTKVPTQNHTYEPTSNPSMDPTSEPTMDPTSEPTMDPTTDPTSEPTIDPTSEPTMEPTADPTSEPTMDPTADPTTDPTAEPTSDPTSDPTTDPTADPSSDPSSDPTKDPTSEPTTSPTMDPTEDPTTEPTMDPTEDPTTEPTDSTANPTSNPTPDPTSYPTIESTIEYFKDVIISNKAGISTGAYMLIGVAIIGLAVFIYVMVWGHKRKKAQEVIRIVIQTDNDEEKKDDVNESENDGPKLTDASIPPKTSPSAVKGIEDTYENANADGIDSKDDAPKGILNNNAINYKPTSKGIRFEMIKIAADLMTDWGLEQYITTLIEYEGYEDVEDWKDLTMDDLTAMNFKTGHAKKFIRKTKEKFEKKGSNDLKRIGHEEDETVTVEGVGFDFVSNEPGSMQNEDVVAAFDTNNAPFFGMDKV